MTHRVIKRRRIFFGGRMRSTTGLEFHSELSNTIIKLNERASADGKQDCRARSQSSQH